MTTTTHQLDNGISLTVYHPAPCDTPQPAVVLCHATSVHRCARILRIIFGSILPESPSATAFNVH